VRSEPGPDYPPIFSRNFLKLIDLKLRLSNPLLESPGYRYLAERNFAKTLYTGGAYKPRAVIATKGIEYLIRSKIADFSTLTFDGKRSGDYVHRLVEIDEGRLLEPRPKFRSLKSEAVVTEWGSIPPMIYLGLLLRNPYRVTRRGKKLISFFLHYKAWDLLQVARAVPWWREYLANKVPLSEWAYLLTEMSKEDQICYANLLRVRQNSDLRASDNLS
jgi:hypothetical protein